MFGLGKTKRQTTSLACLMNDAGYSLVGLDGPDRVRFISNTQLEEPTSDLIAKALAKDVEEHRLYGCSCQVILSPNAYQLVLMDALEVSEQEMAKAVRWQLKGLIEYPLNDIAVDAFIVPPHGAGGKRNKVFAAVTLQSALMNKIKLFETCYLNVVSVSIAEMALGVLLERFPFIEQAPVVVVSYEYGVCRVHVYFKGDLYLFRSLPMNKSITLPNSVLKPEMQLEIQRSIDYCLMELKIAEPKYILFTPSFYQANDLFEFLNTELDKDVRLMDVNSLFASTPSAPEVLDQAFYALGGALMLLNDKDAS